MSLEVEGILSTLICRLGVTVSIRGLVEILVRGWNAEKDGVYEGFEHV